MESPSSSLRCSGCQQPLEPGRAQGLCPRCLLDRAAFTTDTGAAGAPASVPSLDTVATAFPQLEILELIGRGGMGVVYRARQKSLGRLVALKLLAPGRERDPAFAERFAHEARALAALNHPNIVTVHDFGFAPSSAAEAGGFYFLLMEFVDGVNLRQAMKAGRFTPEQALAIVPPVCVALQFAHERGIVHRDIKPENLLLDKDGRIKIADFGIAKMLGEPVNGVPQAANDQRRSGETSTPTLQTAAGTPQYMAPEQRAVSGKTDHRADIYSLGVVLYELLTGELPGAKLQPPSQKVQIDVRLDEIVLRALAAKPELRYATAAEFGTQLGTVVATPSGNSVASPGGVPSASAVSPWSRVVGVFLLLGALMLGSGVVASRRAYSLEQAARKTAELRKAESQEALVRARLGELDSRSEDPLTDEQRLQDAAERRQLAGRLQAAAARRAEVGASPRSARGGTFLRGLLPVLPLVLVGLWLLLRRGGPRADSPAKPRRWMQWFGGGLLGIGLPLGAFGAWIAFRISQDSQWNPGPAEAFVTFATWASSLVFVITGLALLAYSRPGSAGTTSRRVRWSIIVSSIVACLLTAWLLIPSRANRESPAMQGRPLIRPESRLNRLAWKPVRVEDNVVIIDVFTTVSGGPLELSATIDGPAKSEVLAALAGVTKGLPPSLARYGEPPGNRPWTVAPVGEQTWQVGFVFPHSAAAEEAFRGLPSDFDLGEVGFGQWEVFDVIASDGVEYRGHVHVNRLITAGDPAWVSVSGQSSFKEGSLQLTWDIAASYRGVVRVTEGTNITLIPLKAIASGQQPSARVKLVLTPLSDDRVRLVQMFGSIANTREFEGNFSAVAEEILKTTAFTAKATRAEAIELCRVTDESLSVLVAEESLQPAPPIAYRARASWIFLAFWVLVAALGGLVLLRFLKMRGVGFAALVLALILIALLVGTISITGYLSLRRTPLEPPQMIEVRP